MDAVEKAITTQLKNIQTRTGKTLDQLYGILRKSGLAKHSEMVNLLKKDLGLGHGDANMLVLKFREAHGETKAPSVEPAVFEIYSGPKEGFRPIHDRLMATIQAFGPFEIAPKKGYLSLRRSKQFAMLGPVTRTRVEVGLNVKGVKPTSRLVAMPPGGMCQYKVLLTNPQQVDKELIGWLKQAYDGAA